MSNTWVHHVLSKLYPLSIPIQHRHGGLSHGSGGGVCNGLSQVTVISHIGEEIALAMGCKDLHCLAKWLMALQRLLFSLETGAGSSSKSPTLDVWQRKVKVVVYKVEELVDLF